MSFAPPWNAFAALPPPPENCLQTHMRNESNYPNYHENKITRLLFIACSYSDL